MKYRVTFLMLPFWIASAWAEPLCLPVGSTLTLLGTPVLRVDTENGGSRTVWLLSMTTPLCVIDPRFSQDRYRRVTVNQVEVMGRPPPTGVTLSVTGVLMQRKTPDYYIVATDIWVVPHVKVPPPLTDRVNGFGLYSPGHDAAVQAHRLRAVTT